MKRTPLLLLVILLSISWIGCSNDNLNYDSSPVNPNPVDSVPDMEPFPLIDSIVGNWKLIKQGDSEWASYPWILEIKSDSTFTLNYTPFKEPTWLLREGTYYFPGEADILNDPYLGATVFEMTFESPDYDLPQRYMCYLWTDSIRFYNLNMTNVLDASHLYIKVEENDGSSNEENDGSSKDDMSYKNLGLSIQLPMNSNWVPYCELSKQDMPQWLATLCEESEISERPSLLLKGNWNDESIYMISELFKRSEGVLVYNQNGTFIGSGADLPIAHEVENVCGLLIINMDIVFNFPGGQIFPFLPESPDIMPDWLKSFVNSTPKNVEGTIICQGECENSTIFYIYAPYMSSYSGMLYDENGNAISHTIWDSVNNWKCIYKN